MLYPLQNPIREYAWGSRHAIAGLLGQPVPAQRPQAELWMGAHPSLPSSIQGEQGLLPLDEFIRRDPAAQLGSDVTKRFGGEMPFLLKILAAETPLSLQAHPDEGQARAGYDAEENRNVAADSPLRNYKDRHHKPELICALTPFDALCGFRPVGDTVRLLQRLDIPSLRDAVRNLANEPNAIGLAALFRPLMAAEPSDRDEIVRETLTACARHATSGEQYASQCCWACELGERYPGDIGIVSSLLLNHVHLQPGEAVYIPARSLHSYLNGLGVEVMASSDNVLRGGLTPKHVDVPELIRLLDFEPLPNPRVIGRPGHQGELIYDAPADEFRLSRVHVAAPTPLTPWGPEIVLCTTGPLRISEGGVTRVLTQGSSVFIPATVPSYELSGTGTVFRAAVNPRWLDN